MSTIYKILYILFTLHISLYAQESTSQATSTIFCNGILDKPSQVDRYTQSKAIITPITIVPFEDLKQSTGKNLNTALHHIGSFFGKPINLNSMHMGQSGDIQVAEKICLEQNDPYILYGFSRGGAVAVSAAAASGPLLQALVIEGAPYDISRIAYVAKCHLGIPFNHKYLFSFMFPLYDPLHEINAQAIKNIKNKALPIFILHSIPDSAVAISEALRYYAHFKHEGCENVYLIRLPEGRHGKVITNPNMAPLYLEALHSFYKAHNLPYLEKHARFDLCQLKKQFQPNVSDICKEIETDNASLSFVYESSKIRNTIIGATLAGIAAIRYIAKPKLIDKEFYE